MHPANIPILGELTPGTTQRHLIKLPGAALANDEPRPVISVAGPKPGPMLFVNAGVHGGEYPAVEAVIRLGKTLDPKKISGTVILMPVLNLPAFRTRTPFVCPIDNVNPNRVFPGDPRGSYSEQMTHALINEFVVHADAYIDLHGGDIPEALVPFVICRSEAGLADSKARDVAARSKQMALAFEFAVRPDGQQTGATIQRLIELRRCRRERNSSDSSGSRRSWANAGRRGRASFSWSDQCDASFRDDRKRRRRDSDRE